MKRKQPKALITKSNNLVEARYHFSIWETRIFAKMVSLIQPSDHDFKKYRLEIKELIDLFGINGNDVYREIKSVPKSLLKKIVTIPYIENGEERFMQTGLIAGASVPKKNDGYIELSFHPDLKPHLLQLKETFLTYDIKNVLKISSVYSVRIYELLKQYEKLKKRKFDIDALKLVLGVEDKYALYGHFKQRVILKAQKDLAKHTDISFSFEEEKKGRKVIAIIFHIQSDYQDSKTTSPKEALSPKRATLVQQLKYWGISEKRITDYLANYSEIYLEQRIRYVENQLAEKAKKKKTIKNIAAYFNTIVLDKELVDYLEENKQAKKVKLQYQKIQQSTKQQQKQYIKTVKTKRYQEAKMVVDELIIKKPSVLHDAIEMLKLSSSLLRRKMQNKIPTEIYEDKIMQSSVVNQVEVMFPSMFQQIEMNYKNALKKIKP